MQPTAQPSTWALAHRPTGHPTGQPTQQPTEQPTTLPTTWAVAHRPTGQPTHQPTERPTTYPSHPTPRPTTDTPTVAPSVNPNVLRDGASLCAVATANPAFAAYGWSTIGNCPTYGGAGAPAWCAWTGVSCNSMTYGVISVNTMNAALSVKGPIPSAFGGLSQLTSLSFQGASGRINGTLPSALGQLTNLVILDMGMTSVVGSIPSQLGALSSLQYLSFNGASSLTGTLPSALGQLTALEYLDLSNVVSLVGTIPTSFGSLTSLLSLSFKNNVRLTGTIPPALSQLSNLRSLTFPGSLGVRGTLPAGFFASMTSLVSVGFQSTALTGTLPPSLLQLTSIKSLDFGSSNFWMYSSPSGLGQLSTLTALYVSQLTPPQVFPLLPTTLRVLSLASGNFGGTLPTQIASMTALQYLDVNSCGLSGSIPTWLGGFRSLTYLNMQSNLLSGTVPKQLSVLTNLNFLYVSSNSLSGSVPSFLGALPQLAVLQLGSNYFNGSLPSTVNSLIASKGRSNIVLSNNCLRGGNSTNIGPELSGCTKPKLPTAAQAAAATVDGTALCALAAANPSLTYGTVSSGAWQGNCSSSLATLTHRAGWCSWLGVTCDPTSFRVVALNTDLKASGFIQVLPSQLGQMGALTNLLVKSAKGLTLSTFPAWVTQLSNLQQLYLYTAPAVQPATLLFSIPTTIGQMTALTGLTVGGSGVGGPLPPALGALTNLVSLSFGTSSFTGTIPSALGQLTKLQSLTIAAPSLVGSIPSALGQLTKLQSLVIFAPSLTGTIPSTLASLSTLTTLQRLTAAPSAAPFAAPSRAPSAPSATSTGIPSATSTAVPSAASTTVSSLSSSAAPSGPPAVPQVISNFAGTLNLGDGGAAVKARVLEPYGAAVDASGNVYVVDYAANTVRSISKNAGDITTVVGTYGDGGYKGDGGPASVALLRYPTGVAFDAVGNMYVADGGNQRVRVVNKATGTISTLAGNGISGSGGDGGPATSSNLNWPYALAVNGTMNVFIADSFNHKVRVVSAAGIISTYAGTGTAGSAGDGLAATSAQLWSPQGVALDASRSLYIGDSNNGLVRVVKNRVMSTFAGVKGSFGCPSAGTTASAATSARLTKPTGLAFDASGNLFIVDPGCSLVYLVKKSTGYLSVVAGTGVMGGPSVDGAAATSAALSVPYYVAVDASGNLIVPETAGSTVRQVSPTGIISTIAGVGRSPDGAPSASVAFVSMQVLVATDPTSGTVYVSEGNGNVPTRIWQVSSVTGTANWVAGGGWSGWVRPSSTTGGYVPATSVAFGTINGMAVDMAGTLYASDNGNNVVWAIYPSNGQLNVLAGTLSNPAGGSTGDLGLAASAQLNKPMAIATDVSGNVYIADSNNRKVRMVTSGVIYTVAGSGSAGSGGDGGPATAAQFNQVQTVAVDAVGNVYVADPLVGGSSNYRVRMVSSATGIIATVAGGFPQVFWPGSRNNAFNNDNVPAAAAFLDGSTPTGVVVDASGNIYVSDNQKVRVIDKSTGIVTTVAGSSSSYGTAGDGGAPVNALLFNVKGMAVDGKGTIYIADAFRVRAVTGLVPATGAPTAAPSGPSAPPSVAPSAPTVAPSSRPPVYAPSTRAPTFVPAVSDRGRHFFAPR